MTQSKLFSFKDPVNSFPLNLSHQGILPGGRYCGFNAMQGHTGSAIAIKIMHWFTGSFLKVGEDNLYSTSYMGIAITKHGVIIHENSFIPLSVTPNTDPTLVRKDTFYVDHTWVYSEGGTPATYGVMAGSPGNSVAPSVDAYPNRTKLGEFWVAANGSTVSDITYKPSFTPNLGGQVLEEIYARLAEPNKFTRTQALNDQTVTQTEVSGGVLTLQDTGNVARVNITSSTSIEIHSLADTYAATPIIFMLYAKTIDMTGGATLKFVSGGNIVYPSNFAPLSITQDSTFIFLKESGSSYRMIAALQNTVAVMQDLAADIYGLEVAMDDKASLTYRNMFAGLQEWASAQLTMASNYSNGYIIIPDTGNQFVFTGDTTAILVKGIKRTNGSQIIPGTLVSILFFNVGTSSKFVKYNNGVTDGFLFNGLVNYPIYDYSHYLIQRNYTGNSQGMYSAHADLLAEQDKTLWTIVTPATGWGFSGLTEDVQLRYRVSRDGSFELYGYIKIATQSGLTTRICNISTLSGDGLFPIVATGTNADPNIMYVSIDNSGNVDLGGYVTYNSVGNLFHINIRIPYYE